jgi:hypothetical protein
MRVLHIVLICFFLSGCGIMASPTSTPTLIQSQTATLINTPSITSTPDIRGTQRVSLHATLTAQIAKAHATKTEEANKVTRMLDGIKQASNEAEGLDFSKAKLVFGPTSDVLRQNVENTVITFDPGLSLKNFIASIIFVNPYDTSTTGTWDYGILFRNQYRNDQYRLTILSNQSWSLVDAPTWTNVFSRNDKRLTATEGEENTIWLIVVDAKAYLFINGTYIQSLDVSEKLTAGDVSPATGLYYGNKRDRKITRFHNFTVWSLP